MSTPITAKQRLILDNLIYERLSSNPDNKDLVKGIVNKRNPNLVKAIKSERAWQEDQGNITAYFLVKNKDTGDFETVNGSYAGFGYVTDGMEIVDQICADAKPVDGNGTIPADKQPVIESVTVLE